jgi:hypothetical protein
MKHVDDDNDDDDDDDADDDDYDDDDDDYDNGDDGDGDGDGDYELTVHPSMCLHECARRAITCQIGQQTRQQHGSW